METWDPPSDPSKHLPATPSQPDRRSNCSHFYILSTGTTTFGQELISSPFSSLTIQSKFIENETLVISCGWGRYAEHQRLFCKRWDSQARLDEWSMIPPWSLPLEFDHRQRKWHYAPVLREVVFPERPWSRLCIWHSSTHS